MRASRCACLGLLGAAAGASAGWLWLVAAQAADSRGPAWFALKATGWLIGRATGAEGGRLIGMQKLAFGLGGAVVGCACGLALGWWWARRAAAHRSTKPVVVALAALVLAGLALPSLLPFATAAPIAGCWAYQGTVLPTGVVSPGELLAMPAAPDRGPRSGIAGIHVPLGRSGSEGTCRVACAHCGQVEPARYRLDPVTSPPGSGWRHLGLDRWTRTRGYHGYAGFDCATSNGALVLLSYAPTGMYADRYAPARPSELPAIAERWHGRR